MSNCTQCQGIGYVTHALGEGVCSVCKGTGYIEQARAQADSQAPVDAESIAQSSLSSAGGVPPMIPVQDAWLALGGNPDVQMNLHGLLNALKTIRAMDEADDRELSSNRRAEIRAPAASIAPLPVVTAGVEIARFSPNPQGQMHENDGGHWVHYSDYAARIGDETDARDAGDPESSPRRWISGPHGHGLWAVCRRGVNHSTQRGPVCLPIRRHKRRVQLDQT